MYVSLYRKWRPKKFQEVVGQAHITRTLKNAVFYKRISHAYLFSGPRGTGKTTTARILAKALNCPDNKEGEPCGLCSLCKEIQDGKSMDVIEIDAASNRGIDEIRELRERVKYAPVRGKYKVYIIDEVHMLTPQAFNALLKTLEEPPPHIVFVLATTEPYKLLPTILSRCQRFDFKRITSAEVIYYLKKVAQGENVKIEEEALNLIVRAATGSLRDAISLLDQLISYAGENISSKDTSELLGFLPQRELLDLTRNILKGNLPEVISILRIANDLGKDTEQLIDSLLDLWRDLLVLKLSPQQDELVNTSLEIRPDLSSLASSIPISKLFKMIKNLDECKQKIWRAKYPLLHLEIALMELLSEEISDFSSSLVKVKPEVITKKEPLAVNIPSESKKIEESIVSLKTATPLLQQTLDFSKRWEEFLTFLSKNNPVLGSLLNNSKVKLDSNDNLEITVNSKFNLEKLKETYKDKLNSFLEQVFNRSFSLQFSLREPDTQTSVSLSRNETFPSSIRKEELDLMELAEKIFPGEVIDIKNKEEKK